MILAPSAKDIMSCNSSLNGRRMGEAKASAAGPPPERAKAKYLYCIYDQNRHKPNENLLVDTVLWMLNDEILSLFASQHE